jgi:hypothetical protein
MNEQTIKYLVDNLEMTRQHYKWIFTCMDSLLELGAPFVYNISNAVPWIWEENRMIHPKSKLVSMIASDKGWLRGHQNRLKWVEKLKDKVEKTLKTIATENQRSVIFRGSPFNIQMTLPTKWSADDIVKKQEATKKDYEASLLLVEGSVKTKSMFKLIRSK